jgi:CHASE2 domain-containing sensor protein
MPADTHLQSRRANALFPRPFLLSAIVAFGATLLFADLVPRYAPGLLRFEHAMGDMRTSYLSDRLPSQHPHVAIVGISDETLKDNKVRLPLDRLLLARLVDAIDAAGAKAIGIDVLFTRTAPTDNEEQLIQSLRRAKAKVVLGAADERLGITTQQAERQLKFFADAGRPGGYVNLAVERDWVVRFKAQPAPNTAFPKSFPRLLAEGAGYSPDETHRRIAWLREPLDGSDTFLTVPAETLLGPADDPGAKIARAGLRDKVVIIGGLFPDLDQHLTPLSTRTDEKTAGAVIHGHILAEMIDGRRSVQLEANSLAMRLELAAIAALGFLVGWRYRLKNKGLLMGSVATAVIVAVDTFVFWQFRIILPVVLALMAWFLGEFSGRYIGRWLGHRSAERSRWFAK